jgi:hypothetical protein
MNQNKNYFSNLSETNNQTFYFCALILFVFVLLALPQNLNASDNQSYISFVKSEKYFPLSESGKSAPLVVSSNDFPGIKRVIKQFRTDIGNVTNILPDLSTDTIPASKNIVIVGTIGNSSLIDKLIDNKKLDVQNIIGKWDSFLIQVVEKPFPNVDRALVIAGSNKRGTIYGMYDLSSKIGVSPWYWWADVPVKKHSNLYVSQQRFYSGEPKIKYRGIFINDEAPALSGWAYEKFGGFNSKFYEHVFELILRMKGNFLWPAMWGNAFDVDDPINPKLADEYGVVMGTSHHEPMMRAHAEWAKYGKGPWNYEKNDSVLRNFWREGIKRMGNNESVVTLAMRGDGDEAMSPTANVSLLQKIVKDQRTILADITGKDVTTIPQVWALYKEVQEYYDKGMRVPDDVTLLLCDDNWGNIRKLPKLTDPPRSGGYGIYYHYDYVGGPRNYKWLNTNQISRTWEQMHLAYEYGVNKIWIVNVGDIKPMEFPIEFFLDYAWNPEKIPANQLNEYTRDWTEKQFGEKYSKEIADILMKYTKYNSRRKPELLSPDTYSLANYREAEKIVVDYNKLVDEAERINKLLPAEYRDSYFQLVLHPVKACANLNELYYVTGMNRLYAKQGRAETNHLAVKAKELFQKDSVISNIYNKVIANGKWSHMMDQTHIGYTNWQQPDFNNMPEVRKIELPDAPDMGIAIDGSSGWWPQEKSKAVLPEFDSYNRQKYYIDIFNRGNASFDYTTNADKSWVKINSAKGKVETEKRLWVSIDWEKTPGGKSIVPIKITGPNNSSVIVETEISNPVVPKRDKIEGFVESNGYVSIEAEHYTNAVESSTINWLTIPDLGRTLSGITPVPVTAPAQNPSGNSARLEYSIYFFTTGEVKVKMYLSPTLNYHNNQGLRYAVSFDDETPQVINMNKDQSWDQWVSDNIIIKDSKHKINSPGKHIFKYWMIDSGVVLQKIVVETGDVKPSYLGPPESFYRIKEENIVK